MRCINCGWNNPDTAVVCQKCKQPLPVIPGVVPASAPNRMKDSASKKTTREPESVAAPKPEPKPAPKPASETKPESKPEPKPEPKPETKPEPKPAPEPVVIAEPAVAMKLVPLEAGTPIVFDVLPGTVNRASCPDFGEAVDAGCQAEISCSKEGWYIEDKSATKSTYVLASRKIRIEKGDIVILGGRRYVIE